MTNYRKTPDAIIRYGNIEAGDLVTDTQARCLQDHRLGEYGLTKIRQRNGWKIITVREFRDICR